MNDTDVKRRKKILIAAAIGFVAVIIIISVIMILRRPGDNVGGEVEKTSGVIYENPGFATSTMGGSLFGLATSDIESVVMGDAAEGSADTVTAEIDNAGVTSKVSFPYSMYSFGFKVSDGRVYKVNIAANMPSYYGLLVSRVEPAQDTSKLFVVFLGSETQNEYNRDTVISYLLNWAKGLSPKGVYLTTKDIF